MFGAGFMTKQERQDTVEYINGMDVACKIDADEILRAAGEYNVDFSTAIHINMMKCEALLEMGKDIVALTAENYAEICKNSSEEERRAKLIEIVIKKNEEMIDKMADECAEKYATAVALVEGQGKVSISFIQKELRCGYNVASALVEQMEKDGIISVADAVGRRSVLSQKENNPNLGKVLKIKDDPEQPVLEVVAEKDAEVGGIAVDRLRSLIERIERLQEETKALSGDIRDIFAEAKSAGFDVKIMRSIIKLRKMDAADRDEQEFLLETYRKALDV